MKLPALSQCVLLGVLAGLCVHETCGLPRPAPAPRPEPHGSGWVPSGSWSSPASFGAVSPVNPWPAPAAQAGWTDYGVGVDPWAAQVVKKKPSYASLYPWVEKPVYRHVPSYQPQPHGGYAGWTRIPVLDEEGGNQWVAWVPEEFGDFVIVRKDKVKPKNKKKIEEEEEEEEPEPPKPKKKKVKTIVEEEAPEEEPPKPKKKTKTIVEEEAPEEERPKKKVKTIVEDEVPPKKTVTKVVTTEENAPPSTSTTTTSKSSDTSRVTKTEVIEEASTVPDSVSVPAPSSVKAEAKK
ncbi:uncharacterized protein LOC113207595 [Frankliniella occidentalis]|uniref:Uncharacterized protein LOC113207595 n=1 Tax=Frankliniella occidentalis TaxID=133901 RepID=A0A6J1SH29_FRAOC|nr:uncharacterized protein LOC113207595 [Frankliniella occidentalis]